MKVTVPKGNINGKGKLKNYETVFLMKLLGFAAAGFIFSALDALGDMSPFCIAFVSAAPFDHCIAAFIGGSLGFFVNGTWQLAIKYTCCLLAVSLFKTIVERRFSKLRCEIVDPAIAFCAAVSSSLVYLALTEFTGMGLVMSFCEGLLAACSAYFFVRSLRTPVFSIGIESVSVQDAAGVVLSLCTLLLCASGITFGHIAPARIAAAFIVLFFAHYKGVGAGCAAGVCVGTALCIHADYRFLLGMYAVGGLIGGVFSPLGQYTVSVFFAASCAVTAFVSGMNANRFWCLMEIVIACVVFFAMPSKWLSAVHDYLKRSGLLPNDHVNRRVSANLFQAAEAVNEVSDIVSRVSNRLDNVINPEINVIFSKLQQNICFGCSFKTDCWNTHFSETAQDILTVSGVRDEKSGRTELEKHCPRSGALVSQIHQSYTDFVSSMATKTKIRELRNIVTDQFEGVAEFLSEIAEQVGNSRVSDSTKSRAIRTALIDAGIFVDSLNYFTNSNGKITIEINMLDDAFELDCKHIKQMFEVITKRKFEQPEYAIMDLRTTITFEEKAVYKVVFGKSQLPFKDNKICGDCISTVSDLNGNKIALISDGMGTGSRAAVDSTMAATLMEKLLSCGFSFDSALKMVNCSLMVKSSDESIATIDGVSINIYTGEVDFYKAGAAVSFIRSHDTISMIEEQSLPVGILRDISFAHKKMKLDAGDIVVMVSDGVTYGDCSWIDDELLAWSTNNMDDLASHIASLAKLRSDEKTNDDITVVTAKILKNGSSKHSKDNSFD